jgi:hypothetical protein
MHIKGMKPALAVLLAAALVAVAASVSVDEWKDGLLASEPQVRGTPTNKIQKNPTPVADRAATCALVGVAKQRLCSMRSSVRAIAGRRIGTASAEATVAVCARTSGAARTAPSVPSPSLNPRARVACCVLHGR